MTNKTKDVNTNRHPDYMDSPILRLASALRRDGFDDRGAVCEIIRVFPWADEIDVIAAVVDGAPWVMPRGWRRGMFAGRPAMDAIKVAEASIRRRDHGNG